MLIRACAALATTFLLREFFSALRFFFNSKLEQSVVYDMRCDLYERLQRLQTRFFDRRASGDLMSRGMDDIDAVERLVIDGVEQGVISALTVIGVFVILFVLNAQLAFYAMLPVPFLLVGTQWFAGHCACALSPGSPSGGVVERIAARESARDAPNQGVLPFWPRSVPLCRCRRQAS
jgi:ABC-type multidrug transport system fused ATPase/permease subunit